MKTTLFLLACCLPLISFSQDAERGSNLADLTVSAGSYRGSLSLSYLRNWRLGKKHKFGIGIGGRATSFLGANLNYITAPAEITSGSSSPLIFFREDIEENLDTLLIKSPQVNMINVMISFDYRLSEKFLLGFNIDLIGFSFGPTTSGNFMTGNTGKNTEATPTPFNILLISDNDQGSLNSEFYARLVLTPRWSIKAGTQFLFTEYTTNEKVQTVPADNDRFRNKALMFTVGITRKF